MARKAEKIISKYLDNRIKESSAKTKKVYQKHDSRDSPIFKKDPLKYLYK